MAETKENIREDRSKRISKSKDTNNLIADNGLDGKVIDVYDILDRSSEPEVIKLRKLREYGISDEMIAEAYADMTGNVENEETAIETLAVVFKKLALYINQQPNGIILDLKTGDVDKKASYRQAVSIGIADDIYYKRFEKMGQKATREDFLKLTQRALKEERYISKSSKEIGKVFDTSDFKEYLEKDPEYLKLSSEAKGILKNSRKEITKEDPNLMELYKLEIEIENSGGTPIHGALLKEKERFLRANPKYRAVDEELRDEKNNIKPDVVAKYNEYNKNIKINCFLSEFARVKDKDLNSLSPNERKVLLMSALAGLKVSEDSNEKKAINKECWGMIRALNPEASKDNADYKGIRRDDLYRFLEKELELEEKLTPDTFKDLLKICSDTVDKSLDLNRYREYFNAKKFILGGAKKVADKIFNKYFADPMNAQEINFQEELVKVEKTPLELYFTDSKIKFTKKDENEFNKIYQDCTIDSWIDNKDTALELRYATLVRTKEKLKEMPDTEKYRKKIEDVEKEISDFKKEHTDLNLEKEDGTLLDEVNARAEDYENKMLESSLLKYYSFDALEYNDKKVDYSQLDSDHKKAYLRNIIIGLKYGEQSNNSSILKIAQRRLELLNTPDKEFISFKNGSPIISEKQILEEYKSMSDYNYESYDELVKQSEDKKYNYLLKKLKEYSELEDDHLIKLEYSDDKAKMLKQIEKIREASNAQKPINEQENRKTEEMESEEKAKIDTISYPEPEEKTDIQENKKTNWLQKGIDTLKNWFRPRLTDGTSENTKNGFLSRIFGKKAQVDILEEEVNPQTEVANQEPVEIKDDDNRWKVEGNNGKYEVTNSNKDGKPKQTLKEVEQEEFEH